MTKFRFSGAATLAAALLIGCGSNTTTGNVDAGAAPSSGTGGTGGTGGSKCVAGSGGRPAAGSGGAGSSAPKAGSDAPDVAYAGEGPAPGNPDGHCTVPAEAALADSAKPTHIVGSGTPTSCTGDAFISAVARGGVITFNCGPEPVTITLDRPAKIVNDTGPEIVIDGGGRVTLSGSGKTRILYMNTCDPTQKWTTDHCDSATSIPPLALEQRGRRARSTINDSQAWTSSSCDSASTQALVSNR